MRSVHLLALAGVLILALIGVLLFAGDDVVGAPRAVAAAAHGRPTSMGSPAIEASESGVVDQAERSAAVSAVEGERPSLNAAEAPRGVRLIAVSGAARRPVEPVELWWWPEEHDEQRPASESFHELVRSCRIEALSSERAQRIESDENGRFFAPESKAEGFVLASGAGMWGYAPLASRSDDPTYIECEPDTTLQVRVVDEAGAPAPGVRVALRQHYHGQFFTDHGVATTDAQGGALLPHYRALIGGDWDFSARYSIAIAEPLSAEVAREINVTAPPTERVELVLPPVGSVELEFEGAPAHARAGLESLTIGAMPPEERGERFADGRRELAAGSVRFPFVGLGREIVPWSFHADRQQPHDEARRPGPMRAGEEVRLSVRIVGRATRLTGQVVGEAGAALAHAELHIALRSENDEDEEWLTAVARSDSEGRFSASVAPRWSGASMLAVSGARSNGRSFVGEPQRLVVPPGAERLDVGVLQVLEAPLLVTGKVVDRAGALVPFASIDVRQRRVHDSEYGDPYIDWHTSVHGVRSDEHGAFSIWSECQTEPFALQARAFGGSSLPTVARCKQTDVVVVLDCDFAIAGRVFLPPIAPLDFVRVAASADILNARKLGLEESWSTLLDADGEFLLGGLPPGEYQLTVHHQGSDAPLATVGKVRASERPGERDPRLDPLDLRGLTTLVTVEVFGPAGRPVGSFSELRQGEAPGDSYESGRSGHRMILHRDGPPLFIFADGCAFHELVPATAPARVTLQPAPRVRVRLDEALPVLPEGFELGVAIAGVGEPKWLTESSEDWLDFGVARSCTGTVRRVGALSATLWIHGEGSVAVPARFVGAARVVAVTEQQELVLTCDLAKFAEALEGLR